MSAETITLQIGLALVGALMVVPALFYVFLQRRQKLKSDPASRRKDLIGTSSKKNQLKMTDGESSDCAWEERRLRGIAAASSHEKKDAGTEKPFGSSYYYAHNSTRATGGYKDGLRMEDYTMNGPRLLSRGGKPVDGEKGDDDDDAAIQVSASNTSASGAAPSALEQQDSSSEKQQPIGFKRSVPISRYLWDDPGDATTAVATIRIEQLPGPRSTDPMVPWKDASVTKVHAELLVNNNNDEQQGLLVTIETADTAGVDYELRIPKLYGRVAEVEAITKPKRLLLRLKKKKGFFDKTNLKAWPHPQKKMS